ncbi:MAG: phosphoglucosamine mutase [Actinomycetota bacterium]|nr:phosphoglucosamine mutase [Actinomycetota bacterium]
MGRLFGTDGVRGIANDDLSPELAFKLGWAGASFLIPRGSKGKIVVGRDTRISGDLLESALVTGICSAGVDVLKVGVMPTPGIAYLTRVLGANAGVVISASHNPAEYNGIKFFDSTGFKLSDETEDKIEELMSGRDRRRPTGAGVGNIFEVPDAVERYVDHVVSTIPADLEGFTVALDCANGSACTVSPLVLRQLGAEVLVFAANPDGVNINKECGSTYPQYVQEIVRSHRVDLGLAHDGDADRVIAVDENGEIVDGDFAMAICATHLKREGRLPQNAVVTTVMTNMGFDLAMRRHGINVVKTPVGDRYVLEEMLARDIVMGGEQSGHIIFLEHNTTGDGIITALQLMRVMRDTAKKLSELKKIMSRLPQVLLNVPLKDRGQLESATEVWREVRAAEEELEGRGRVLVRPSGTEPLVRVMVESDSEEEANSIARRIAGIIERKLV